MQAPPATEPQRPNPPQPRSPARFLPLVLLLCYAGILWNANDRGNSRPMLVFTSPLFNTLALSAGLFLPAAILIVIVTQWRGVARLVAGMLVGLLLPFSLLLIPLVWLFGSHALTPEADASFTRLRSVPLGRYEAVVYRTNGGATTDYGITVQQELPLIPGLRLIRPRYRHDHADNATVQILSPDLIRIRTNRVAPADDAPDPVRFAPFGVF